MRIFKKRAGEKEHTPSETQRKLGKQSLHNGLLATENVLVLAYQAKGSGYMDEKQ